MKYSYNVASPDRYLLLKEKAKELKHFSTEAESYLWNFIRARQLGVKFNRQHIIGDYIVDFVCLERKLIIEVDGEYHDLPEQNKDDFMRTEELSKIGFNLIRFKNAEIMNNIKDVLYQIREKLKD